MVKDKDYYFEEDVLFLEKWLDDAISVAKSLSHQAKYGNGLSVFTISTTTKLSDKHQPYLTPIIKIYQGYVGGAVVFSQTQAFLIAKHIDGLIDQILVDAEKKIGITLGVNQDVIKHFNLKETQQEEQARIHVEMGNLSAACSMVIKKSEFHEFKPNDMTVDAVWYFLSNNFRVLSGKKFAIIGSGNIGFKLAVKLIESGSNVELVRRDMRKGTLMADIIDIIKPQSTLATGHYNSDPLQASLFCDGIIGCSNGKPLITWEMIQSMKPNGIVIDVGKGTVYKKAAIRASQADIPIYRCDISSAINGVIATIERNKHIIANEIGRLEIKKDLYIISGGKLGQDGDIVVDCYSKPKQIFGVADGVGDLKQKLSKSDRIKIQELKGLINGDNP